MPTPLTLNIALQNRTASNFVYAYVTGRALDKNNALFLLHRDGTTGYFPSSPRLIGSPLVEDCAIHLGAPGETKTVIIPHLAGARIYFSVDGKLTFMLNPGPALVEPSVTNPTDPNISINWGFAEFTYNDNEVYANISYVDFVSLPISLTLTTGSRQTQHVSGMPANGLDLVCDKLQAQDNLDHAGWSRLIVKQPNSDKNLRALSPNIGIMTDNALFRGYYQPYVDAVWSKYSTDILNINTQSGVWGIVTGQVRKDGVLDMGGATHLFTQPSAADIFSCSTGPFAEMRSPARGTIIARLAAAFHRSTLLHDHLVPDDPPPFYAENITNHYARIVHEVNQDGRGYAFPYDDVTATGGRDDSGAVHDNDPRLLTVEVGGEDAFAAASLSPPLKVG